MKRDKIIELTEEYLKSVPDLKKRIRLIDVALEKGNYDEEMVKKLKEQRHRLNYKLSKVIKAVSTLDDTNQRIVCYRYFNELSYSEIVKRVGLSVSTIPRRIKGCLLSLGRIMFGMEDEFWREVYMIDY